MEDVLINIAPLRIAWIVLLAAIFYYVKRLIESGDPKGILLEDRLRVSIFLREPEEVRFKYQMSLSQHMMERISPTKVLQEILEKRNIPATVPNSQVLEFFINQYRGMRGITSSVLNTSEGKTLTCLSILSQIEEENRNIRRPNGTRVAFLYVLVPHSGGSITKALRQTLRIKEGIHINKIVSYLSANEDGGYTIYGLIDQVGQWYQQDHQTLRCLAYQQHENLFIHVPTAVEDVAQHFAFTDNSVKVSYSGPVSNTGRHELGPHEAKEYTNMLTSDRAMRARIRTYAEQLRKKKGFASPRLITEAYIALLIDDDRYLTQSLADWN